MAPNTTVGGSANHRESEMSAKNSDSQERSCDEESPREKKIFREESDELVKDLDVSDDDNDDDSSCNSSCSCNSCSSCDGDSSSDDDEESGSSSFDTDSNKYSLERNSVDERPRECNIADDSEELFKDFELFDDYVDGSSTRSCSCKSRCFCDSKNSSSDDEDSNSDDEDSRSYSEKQKVTSTSWSTSEEEPDEETQIVLNLAYLKLSAIKSRSSQLRKYLLLTVIKNRVLESIRVLW